jgi:hypothetical protein
VGRIRDPLQTREGVEVDAMNPAPFRERVPAALEQLHLDPVVIPRLDRLHQEWKGEKPHPPPTHRPSRPRTLPRLTRPHSSYRDHLSDARDARLTDRDLIRRRPPRESHHLSRPCPLGLPSRKRHPAPTRRNKRPISRILLSGIRHSDRGVTIQLTLLLAERGPIRIRRPRNLRRPDRPLLQLL